jgi:hypothetical protein
VPRGKGKIRRFVRRHALHLWATRIIGSRRALFVAAMVLLLIPAGFTIRPGDRWYEWTWLQWTALVTFAGAGVVAQLTAARQFHRIMDLIRPIEEHSKDVRTKAAAVLLEGLLDTPDPDFEGFEFRVYVYDTDSKMLQAVWSPKGSQGGAHGWKIGEGVVGHAYEYDDWRVAFDDECWDGTYNVPPDRADRYKDLRSVGAVPCRNARRQVVAVLAVSSRVDSTRLRQANIQAKLHMQANAVARVIIDVLRDRSD